MGGRIAFNFTNKDGDSRLTIAKNVADRIIYLTILPVLLSFYQIRLWFQRLFNLAFNLLQSKMKRGGSLSSDG